jgi:hypothetical protein
MKKRPQGEFHKQLPMFKMEYTGAGWMRIECTRCGGVAWVRRGPWLHSMRNRHLVARACTYCMKVSRVL